MERIKNRLSAIFLFIMGVIILLQNIRYFFNFDTEFSSMGFAIFGVYSAVALPFLGLYYLFEKENRLIEILLIAFSIIMIITWFIMIFIFRELLQWTFSIFFALTTYIFVGILGFLNLRKLKKLV